jgi:hypothetical protein
MPSDTTAYTPLWRLPMTWLTELITKVEEMPNLKGGPTILVLADILLELLNYIDVGMSNDAYNNLSDEAKELLDDLPSRT